MLLLVPLQLNESTATKFGTQKMLQNRHPIANNIVTHAVETRAASGQNNNVDYCPLCSHYLRTTYDVHIQLNSYHKETEHHETCW